MVVTCTEAAHRPVMLGPPQARANGWFLVSDTSWAGYTEVPRQIMQGYRIMADEAADQWHGPPPTHVFIQGVVGGVSAAVSARMRERFHPAPALIVVEPDKAASLLVSAIAGADHSVRQARYDHGWSSLRRAEYRCVA
jgi:diaminopropionate ammonia-lyase